MTQTHFALIIVLLALGYIIYRMYQNIQKRKACDKCSLMEAAREASSGKK